MKIKRQKYSKNEIGELWGEAYDKYKHADFHFDMSRFRGEIILIIAMLILTFCITKVFLGCIESLLIEQAGVAEVFVPMLLATTIWFVIILPLRTFIKRKEYSKHVEVMMLERQARKLEGLLDLYSSLEYLNNISDEDFEKFKVIRLINGFKLQKDEGTYINELQFSLPGCTNDVINEIFANPEVLDLTIIDRFVDSVKNMIFITRMKRNC